MSTAQRLRDIATALAAAITLLAIVAGVPGALITFVGWPLPTTVPSPGAIAAALRYGTIPPATLLKGLALVVWCAWGLMTASLAVEAVALVRGTVARALAPAGPLQHLAARLLAATMLLSTVTTRPAAAAVTEPMAQPAQVAPVASASADAAPSAPTDKGDREHPTYVVQRRDSLWSIAERLLGDGRRWREIRDLNAGRSQPGGGRLAADGTTIHPGWVLRLPDDADTSSGPPRTAGERIEVREGDHLWGLAETHLGDGRRWHELYDRNAGALQPDGRRLTTPEVIEPGWVLDLPADAPADDRDGPAPADDRGRDARPGRSPVPGLVVTPDTLPGDGDGDGAGDEAPQDHADAPDARATAPPVPEVPPHRPPPPPADQRQPAGAQLLSSRTADQTERDTRPVTGVALLAAGITGLIAARRRQWLRHRRPGSALAPLDPETAELERWLREMADHDLNHRTDRVLRVLAELCAAHDLRPPVGAVEIGDHVRLLLTAADDTAPPGVTVSDRGHTWQVDEALEVAAPGDDDHPPLIPALVSCGQRASGDVVGLHLLGLGVVDIDGPAERVRQILTAWTVELAGGKAADGVEIIVVGPHHDLVEQFARVMIADDEGAAAAAVDRALGAGRFGGAATHAVVFSMEPASGLGHHELRRRARDPRVAAVFAGATDAEHTLRLDGDRARLEPLGIDVELGDLLSQDAWDHVGDLLAQPVRAQPSDLIPSPLHAPWPGLQADGAVLDTAPERLVRVLGPLAVDGVDDLRPRAGDLLALLAVRGDGRTVEDVAADLGVPIADMADLVRAVEPATGADDHRSGADLLSVSPDGCLHLAPGVRSDLEQFHRLAGRVDHHAPAAQAAALQEALSLVRGTPFSDAGGWAHDGGFAASATALVSDAAHRLATLAMTFGDLTRAGWAVDRGLLANPGCELLHRDRMRIADARGDAAGIEAAMQDAREHAAADGGWLSPETVALYERLRRDTAPPTAEDHRHAS